MAVALFILGASVGSALTFVWVALWEGEDKADFFDQNGEG